jgi:L-ascorbate metabolism protein UlaG (beta-lactamase superfamily)
MKTLQNINVSFVNSGDFVGNSANGNLLALRWLGQAGFQMFYKDSHLMIDPYLSDHLAKKYAGKEFEHIRIMPSPLEISRVTNLDLILCTHRHSDHMDSETVPVLLNNNLVCKIIAPKAEKEHIFKNIVADNDRVMLVNADEKFDLTSYIRLEVMPSAHE